jgi:putative transposase
VDEPKKYYNLNALSKVFYADFTKDKEWMLEHNTKVLKQAMLDFDDGMNNLFNKNMRNKQPTFKRKQDRNDSARFITEAISVKNLKDGKLHLNAKLKDIEFCCSDRDRLHLSVNKDKIRSVTLSQDKTGCYFASIILPAIKHVKPKFKNYSIGIDLGLKVFAVTSQSIDFDANVNVEVIKTIENPNLFRNRIRQIKLAHRSFSRKMKDSNNKEKARIKLAKLYKKVTNQKDDFLHKLSQSITHDNQVVCIEDLKIQNMVKNRKLSQRISYVGWGGFKTQVKYKSLRYDGSVSVVPTNYPSSQNCCRCGNKDAKMKDLKMRTYECGVCGSVLDRDTNAAINIEHHGVYLHKNKIAANVGRDSLTSDKDNLRYNDANTIPVV